MGHLRSYYDRVGFETMTKWSHYFAIYERHFERFKGKSPVVVEIGVAGGGSLRMWRDYFSKGCRIVGVDIHPDCLEHIKDGITVELCDQSSPRSLKGLAMQYPQIDILIDDGSHINRDQAMTFDLLWPSIVTGGVYLAEDIHTSFWENYGGGGPDSFLEKMKGHIDEMTFWHDRNSRPTRLTREVASMTFYDSVVVVEKGEITKPTCLYPPGNEEMEAFSKKMAAINPEGEG